MCDLVISEEDMCCVCTLSSTLSLYWVLAPYEY